MKSKTYNFLVNNLKSMFKNLKMLLLLLTINIIPSCAPKDDEVIINTEKVDIVTKFIAGYHEQEVSSANGSYLRSRAMYWYKNGANFLGDSFNSSKALGVFGVVPTSSASENYFTYTVGFEEENGVKKARLWKDKAKQPLEIGTGQSVATGIFVVNNTDFYVSGYETNPANNITKAIYWKNGERYYLTTNEQENSYTTSITVTDNIVYVAGYKLDQSNEKAVYWKNQQVVELTVAEYSSGPTAISQVPTAIIAKNNKVYCGGYAKFSILGSDDTEKIAIVWKNNLAVKIGNGESRVNCIQVDDLSTGFDNIYCGGSEYRGGNPTAAIWKNGLKEYSFESGSVNSSIYSIIKTDNIYYKVGFHDDVRANFWSTNDTRVALENPLNISSYATSVHVLVF